MHFKRLKRMIKKLAPAGLAFLCLFACSPEEKEQPPALSTQELPEEVVVEEKLPHHTGRLYTSGLSAQEADALALTEPVYQLVGAESFFFTGSDSPQEYLGQCLRVEGPIRSGWEDRPDRLNQQFTYGRAALEVHGILLQEPRACLAFPMPEGNQQAMEVKNYSGELRRMERPAPDIAYDYLLVLEEPFVDEYHPVQPGQLVRELPLSLSTAEQLQFIEESLRQKKRVNLQAALVQGYAERKVLQVQGIHPGA